MENLYTLKVYLPRRSREIYRVLAICGDETMDCLCDAILNAFDFDHDHLHEFYLSERKHRGPMILGPGVEDFGEGPYSYEVQLDRLNLVKGQKIYLHYDFGDDWVFVISTQKVENVGRHIVPRVIKSKGELEQYPVWDEEDE